ncbi:NH(3)-dependent NAD(+) synthetase [Candidatus Zixiibacteriota bacterium]|nr:NH(3)-dependent NAD(+) synthetase [candidate division Zixibacteria bacterium]
MVDLSLNEVETAKRLELFLKEKLNQLGLAGYIIGLSGGIDSSLSAAVAARAVGADKVHGLLLPYRHSSEASIKDAVSLAAQFSLKTEKIDISPMIDAYYPNIEGVSPVRAGNKMARERMSILFDKAHELKSLVLGTSNRTEICLGYGTWYGDVACSVNPLGMLYKTQVRQMAGFYKIPPSIQEKPPTADLWPGQTDEDELELEYEKVDRLLYLMIDMGIRKRADLNAAGFSDKFINRAVNLLNTAYFKRHLPEIADTGLKPIPDKITIS